MIRPSAMPLRMPSKASSVEISSPSRYFSSSVSSLSAMASKSWVLAASTSASMPAGTSDVCSPSTNAMPESSP